MSAFIQQRGPADCGIAAIAMFTGLTYEEVRAAGIATGEYRTKKGTYSSDGILRHLGYKQENFHPRDGQHDYVTREGEFRTMGHLHFFISGGVLRQLLWGRRALVTVKSLNNEDGSHLIYYDGREVQDPQKGRRGKRFHDKWENVEVREIIVWREVK